jgi:hypothetical protein
MPDEGNISPTFGRKYGVLEQVFDWAHIFHAQTADVLASTKLTNLLPCGGIFTFPQVETLGV